MYYTAEDVLHSQGDQPTAAVDFCSNTSRGREPGGAEGARVPPLFDKGGLSPPKIGGYHEERISLCRMYSE